MKAAHGTGLIAAGPMSPTLFQLANLNEHLELVAAGSLRVASRLANRLKAGRAAGIDEFSRLELVLISGPDSATEDLIEMAVSSGVDWTGKTVVLLDSRRDTTCLAALSGRGALTATLDTIDAFPDPTFLCDCPTEAVRLIQRFTAGVRARTMFLAPGAKQRCFGALGLNHCLFGPVFDASVRCLQSAGLSPADSATLAERMIQHTIRSWLKAGRKGWSGPLRDGDRETLRKQHDALAQWNRDLAEYFAFAAAAAVRLSGEDSSWLRDFDSGAGSEEADNGSHAARAGR